MFSDSLCIRKEAMSPIISLILGAILGVVAQEFFCLIRNFVSQKKEIADNNNINISGNDWFAAWQTSVDDKQIINTESLTIVQRGKEVIINNNERSPENPIGGYLWKAKMHMYQGRSLMGWYFPLKSENNTSKGIMYMTYFSQRKEFYGKWIGSGYDGDLEVGFLVFCKDRSRAKDLLSALISKHPDDVKIIGYKF